MKRCSELTFLCPAVPEMPLCGSGPPEAAAALAVCSSSPRRATAAAWPRRSPPAQTPPTRLCSSCCWPRRSRPRCCCRTRPQVPRSKRSWQSRGQPARRRERTARTGSPNSRCFRCCCYYRCRSCCLDRSHPTASCQSASFGHTNSTDVKTCKKEIK